MSEPSLQTWQSEDGALVLRYDLRLLHGIRAEVTRGMQRARGEGVETGGILLGSVSESGEYVLQSWWPIRRDHARGASFRMSSSDVAALATHVEALAGGGTGRVLGWFAGRSPGQTLLRHEEKQFHVNTFPASAPLFMIVVPGSEGDAEFRFCRITGGDRPSASLVPGILTLAAMPAPTAHRGQQTRFRRGRARKTRAIGRRWIVLAVAVAAGLIFFGAGWQVWQQPLAHVAKPAEASNQELSEDPMPLTTLHVRRLNDRLDIAWEPITEIKGDARATLTVTDQGRVTVWELSNEDLARGRMRYRRASAEVRVTLRVERDGEETLVAHAHYLAAAPNQ